MASTSLEGMFAYLSESFSAGVIQSYQGQGFLEDTPLIQQQDPLEDFKKFNSDDLIFQEYDPPLQNDSKMAWKKSRPSVWWKSLWKAIKCIFYIQILGGLALGSLAILILVLDFNSVDLCFDRQLHGNWHTPRPAEYSSHYSHCRNGRDLCGADVDISADNHDVWLAVSEETQSFDS